MTLRVLHRCWRERRENPLWCRQWHRGRVLCAAGLALGVGVLAWGTILAMWDWQFAGGAFGIGAFVLFPLLCVLLMSLWTPPGAKKEDLEQLSLTQLTAAEIAFGACLSLWPVGIFLVLMIAAPFLAIAVKVTGWAMALMWTSLLMAALWVSFLSLWIRWAGTPDNRLRALALGYPICIGRVLCGFTMAWVPMAIYESIDDHIGSQEEALLSLFLYAPLSLFIAVYTTFDSLKLLEERCFRRVDPEAWARASWWAGIVKGGDAIWVVLRSMRRHLPGAMVAYPVALLTIAVAASPLLLLPVSGYTVNVVVRPGVVEPQFEKTFDPWIAWLATLLTSAGYVNVAWLVPLIMAARARWIGDKWHMTLSVRDTPWEALGFAAATSLMAMCHAAMILTFLGAYSQGRAIEPGELIGVLIVCATFAMLSLTIVAGMLPRWRRLVRVALLIGLMIMANVCLVDGLEYTQPLRFFSSGADYHPMPAFLGLFLGGWGASSLINRWVQAWWEEMSATSSTIAPVKLATPLNSD